MPLKLYLQIRDREPIAHAYPSDAKIFSHHFTGDPNKIRGQLCQLPSGLGANQALEQIGIDALHPHPDRLSDYAIALMPHTRPGEMLVNNILTPISPNDSEIILRPQSTLKASTPPNASLSACLVIEYIP